MIPINEDRIKPKKKVRLSSLNVFEDQVPVGKAFINYDIRGRRILYMMIQIKDPKNLKKVDETFMIQIPMPMIYVLKNIIDEDGGIKKKATQYKWQVSLNDRVISKKRLGELLR